MTGPLTNFKGGTSVVLVQVGLKGAEARRLRELGLCEGARILILQNDEKLIVVVERTRIGLRREIGYQLLVKRI